MKRLVVDMQDDLHTAIKIEAIKKGKSAKQLVTELIQDYLGRLKEDGRSSEG